jgi:hypothetical protein
VDVDDKNNIFLHSEIDRRKSLGSVVTLPPVLTEYKSIHLGLISETTLP